MQLEGELNKEKGMKLFKWRYNTRGRMAARKRKSREAIRDTWNEADRFRWAQNTEAEAMADSFEARQADGFEVRQADGRLADEKGGGEGNPLEMKRGEGVPISTEPD